jgi:hypothetical protein
MGLAFVFRIKGGRIVKKLSLLFFVVCLLLVCSSVAKAEVVADIYTDNFEDNGKYTYVYPEGTCSIEEVSSPVKTGATALKVTLDPTVYAGAAVGGYPLMDISAVRNTGKLEFWIKGEKGGEKCEVMLLDAEDSDGTKAETGVVITPKYVVITTDWKKVSIPLSAFKDQGQYWDWDSSSMKKDTMKWDEIKELKIDVRPYDKNSSFTVYLDDIKIVN